MRKILRALGALLAIVVVVALAAGGWFWWQLDGSLPAYDGTRELAGLSAPVTIERDALGVVTIHSSDRLDEARALGFVHAQERFFQMDLLRRSAAGELSALVGAGAIGLDEARRVHQLRNTAERVVATAPAGYRDLLDAYAAGVNAGLAALDAAPFEYLLLRVEPALWTAADSVLAVGAMFFDLQGGDARHELSERAAREVLAAPVADFLYPRLAEGDAPIDGTASPPAALPGPDAYDLRTLPIELFGEPVAPRVPPPVGSNNWAVGGAHTASGRGLVANDMHLGLQVPATWFRLELRRDGRRITGVSLPGTPLIVVGSNGHVAWGFTNSYGDWMDVVPLEVDDLGRYLTPDGWRAFESVSSPIEVAHDDAHAFEFRTTEFGPVLGELVDGTPYALRWTAHEPRAYAAGFLALADAHTVDDAIAAANRSGIPAQNFVVADADGNIGWTIMGQIPDRDARGWLEPGAFPRVVNPASGRIWTANSRVVGGEMLASVGDGGYAYGHRAAQIRDRLLAIEAATPADMLAVQLDDESRFHARWRDALLTLLDDATAAEDSRYAAVRDVVVKWDGHAAVDSVGFRVVRGWRNAFVAHALSALTAEVRAQDEAWRYVGFRSEAWAWPLLRDQPAHLLDPRYASWRALQLAALDELLAELEVERPEDLAEKTWGARNTVRVRHPLSAAVPFIGAWLDMPAQPLPGETYTPRVQGVAFGASQRMAVSPGDEANGYFHMPGGQSGHPRSPYYGAGHGDWAAGRPTPFLPGPAQRTLTLAPPADAARVHAAALPSGAGAVAPNLSTAPDGSVLLSWIEPRGDEYTLLFARHRDDAWSEPSVIASGDRWFVNWADFPALVELGDGTLVAHWLRKSGKSTYAYDVVVTRSVDGGATWSDPQAPHADGTETEHGFVSLLPVADDRVRIVWLDGRETVSDGMMTLRTRTLTSAGGWGDETLLDPSVCDCCQTAAVTTSRGVTVAYRDRTSDETRDLYFTSLRDGTWTAPRALHDDGWRISACPVNGPALAAAGERVVATWFTGAGGVPRAYAAFSADGGDSFGDAVLLDAGATLGRVHAALLPDGSALLARLDGSEGPAAVRLQRVHADGRVEPPVTVARSDAARASGFPRIAAIGDGTVLVVWTEPGEPGGLRAARVSLPSAP